MQLDQIYLSKYNNRILKMREMVITQPHEICIERAELFTDSYKKTKGEPSVLRFAKAMDHFLRHMTIKIWDDEYIVGNRTIKLIGTPLFPETRVDTIELDCDSYDKRLTQRLLITDDERRVLKEEIIPYWKTEEQTVQARFFSYLTPELRKIMDTLVFVVDTEITNGIGHFFPGHENVLKNGINGLIKKAENKLKDISGTSPEDINKRYFLDSVILLCNAVKAFIKRFEVLAKELAETEIDLDRRNELNEISETCKKISENPPNTFKEAIQLIYFIHLICGLEDGGFAISIGRLDQLLYPYYLKDKAEGRIADDEAQFILECFFLKLCTLWNYVLTKGVIAAEGPPLAENLTIGGLDRDGNDTTNELSYLILKAYTNVKTLSINLNNYGHCSTRR